MKVTVPVERTRYVIVHYHIFKNAGSTIEHILEREFGGRFATVHGSDPDATLDAEELEEFLRQQPAIEAVSSHHLRYPKPVGRHAVYFDCCFLRDPIARLYSCYDHYRRGGVGSPYAGWAQSLSAREFALRLVDECPHLVSDVQTMQLANGGAFTRPADARDLERASAAMRKMAVPGWWNCSTRAWWWRSTFCARRFLNCGWSTFRRTWGRAGGARSGNRGSIGQTFGARTYTDFSSE